MALSSNRLVAAAVLVAIVHPEGCLSCLGVDGLFGAAATVGFLSRNWPLARIFVDDDGQHLSCVQDFFAIFSRYSQADSVIRSG